MDASVTFLLENLTQVLKNHYDLVSNAENELRLLEKELKLMKASLEDAYKKPNKNKVFLEWENQVRDVVDQVEDTLDTYITKEATKNIVRRVASISSTSLAKDVKKLREGEVQRVFVQVKNALSELAAGDKSATQVGDIDKRNKTPRQDNFVGFADVIKEFLKYLIDEKTERLEVLSIVGMPGLGKTAVAWQLHRHSSVQYEFPTIIWINVSEVLNKKAVFLTILKKFTQQDLSALSDEELGEMVKEYLARGKFFIVMDDVWTVADWNEIRKVLPMENKDGKILITTRDKNVACHANPQRYPHLLRFLKEDESWELLRLEVFDNTTEKIDQHLERIGKQIANKCDGLPLAIIVIAGILVDKFSVAGDSSQRLEEEWNNVLENVESSLINEDKDQIMGNIISLSYTKLPYELRDCFLYLGMFPEDSPIPAWKLIQLWIAEGFVKPMPNKSLEEIARNNLKELINRNLIMVLKTKPDGEVKTCGVHDTVREFCKKEGGYEKNCLFQEIKISKGVFDPPIHNPNLDKYRRICVHSSVDQFLSQKPKILKARSFVSIRDDPVILQDKDISSITDAFSLLRVFEASIIKFPKFPPKIIKFLHLRYLTLAGDELKKLPDPISKLLNIETLIIYTSSRTLVIEADIWKMIKLRYLKTKASISLNKTGTGSGGENLRTLSRLSPQSCTTDVFKRAKNLNTLGIRGDLSELMDSKCLETLEHVNKLKLLHDVFPKGAFQNPLKRLPQSHCFPPKLKILVLIRTYLDWGQMSTVEKLGSLEVLKLKDNAFMGNAWDANSGGFKSLQFLYVERSDLMFWTAKNDSFPRLKTLVLKNCEKLEKVPYELKHNLEMLSMECVTQFAVRSALEIKVAKQKEQQGPHIEARRGVFKLVIARGDQIPESQAVV